ncbi:hypothetical protein [Rubritalea tangerina]|uniref:hypothetical protein n=1 Tax=Rubritalea tangerina TaxID=430798 RepID=UPI0036224594
MTLLVLLLVGMLSLATTETRSATQEKYIMEARANARMALMVALAELQEEMGPDQRVSAWAGIMDTDPSTEEIDSVESPHLLGVWDSWKTYLNEPLDGATIQSLYGEEAKGSRFRRWLVSRKDSKTAENVLLPRDGAASEGVALVAEGTLGGSAPKEHHVRAEVVPTVLDSERAGGYAWWVGSQNLKASLNFRESEDEGLGEDEAQLFAAELSHFDPREEVGFEQFPDTEEERKSLVDYKVTEHLTDASGGYEASKSRYFDFTHAAQGVLCNVTSGGTKKDLNLLFELDVFPDAYREASVGGALVNAPVRKIEGTLPSPKNPNILPADWRHLRDYYRLYTSADHGLKWDADGNPYTERHMTADVPTHAVRVADVENYTRLPVLLRYSYIFGLRSKPNEDPDYRDCYFTSTPVMVFWNPYNVTMRYPADAFLMHTAFYKSQYYQFKVYVNSQHWGWESARQSDTTSLGYLQMRNSPEKPDGDIVMRPGELLMFTPHSVAKDRAYIGYDPSLPELTGSQAVIKGKAKKTDKVRVALRFSEIADMNSIQPQNCHWWGVDKSGAAILVDDNAGKEGVYHHSGDSQWPGYLSGGRKHQSGLFIDWFESEDNLTPIIEDNPATLAEVDMSSEEITPIAVVNYVLKTGEEPVYQSPLGGGQVPAGAKDFRNRTWLHSQALSPIQHLQGANDVKRSNFAYQMHYEPVSGLSLSQVIQEVDGNAFSGGGTDPARVCRVWWRRNCQPRR